MFRGAMFQKSKKYWEYEGAGISLAERKGIMMKKKAFLRGLLGFPLGLALGYMITIAISLLLADGYYSPCVPALIDAAGSEIGAVLLQAVLSGLLGAGFGAASVIWEIEAWGLVKQTGIYFLIGSVLMLPVAYVNYWMEHSVQGVLSYFGIFAAIFVVIWIVQYAVNKRRVGKMNETLRNMRR